LNVGPHLPKLLSNIKQFVFFGTRCITLQSVTTDEPCSLVVAYDGHVAQYGDEYQRIDRDVSDDVSGHMSLNVT